ncbi:TetR/AcrR family transcriptional regulator [Streptomyces sp. NL15-2K]|uniref:TetR/AcrR family transcriptional regulator n=1 Tax=Streptomyces sp. NL15-2K TaxID=376149 RepID=UPI000F57B3B8|nr:MULTISPECIES: TetR family transcriptional regulator [Actinomycetes]WKX14112.1 TetR family transcriptional regulator [Kutzneria buriramensis]GCB44738.1 tetR family transcriptional regulator [Streptomyces sp. NL15-2K]
MTIPRRSSGRPRKLTNGDIIDAVLEEGFAGITVPAVARRLGVSTMTLYRYAPTRADLLALAWNHVITTTNWPPLTGPWRQILHTHATAFWHLLAQYPGVVTELSQALMPTEMMHRIDDVAVALVDQGFTAEDAVLSVDLVIDLTVDHRRGVENIHGLVDAPATLDAMAQLWAPKDTDPPNRRAVRAAMANAITLTPFDWFTQKLDLALRGIDARFQR